LIVYNSSKTYKCLWFYCFKQPILTYKVKQSWLITYNIVTYYTAQQSKVKFAAKLGNLLGKSWPLKTFWRKILHVLIVFPLSVDNFMLLHCWHNCGLASRGKRMWVDSTLGFLEKYPRSMCGWNSMATVPLQCPEAKPECLWRNLKENPLPKK